MINKTVIALQVETIKGDKVDRVVVHYNDENGTPRKLGNLAKKLDEAVLTTLKTAKTDIEAGKTVYLSIDSEKEGQYWNLVGAKTAGGMGAGAYTHTKSNATVKSKETDTRIQVMNALTNAIVSLGAGKTTKEYKERVVEFVALGNDVVSSVLEGNTPVPVKAAETYSDAPVDDLGF